MRCGVNSTPSYRALQVFPLEASMKTSSVPVQCDLFDSVPVTPVLAIPQHHRDELVELLSRLLWQVVQGADEATTQESPHEQDHR